jgi:hypothetical protein
MEPGYIPSYPLKAGSDHLRTGYVSRRASSIGTHAFIVTSVITDTVIPSGSMGPQLGSVPPVQANSIDGIRITQEECTPMS